MKTRIFKNVLFLTFTILFFNGCGKDSAPCIDTNCIDYSSQFSAQLAFDADPDCRGDLDADNDGIACEEPGNATRTCPTTANCGCSGINKLECETDPCCRWIVGSGCECI